MRIILPCPTCTEELIADGGGIPSDGVVVESRTAPVQDDGIYRTKCPNDHPLLVVLGNLPFELLFESGLEALVDGYFRESISSFASALERLYEFSIRVQLTSCSTSNASIETMWKSVAMQSERQLGMYIALRTSLDGSPPPLLDQKLTKLRNAVIHKGYFSSSQEATEFGNATYELIIHEAKRLNTRFPNAVNITKEARRVKAFSALQEGDTPQYLWLGLAVATPTERPFSEILRNASIAMTGRRTGQAPCAPDSSSLDC
jgi:hypothetical protein